MLIAFDHAARSNHEAAAPVRATTPGPWSMIPLEGDARGPRVVQCEVRWPVSRLLGEGPTVDELSNAWSRAHDRVEALVAAATLDEEPAVSSSATRARRALLRDAQASQRSPRRKVSYGRVMVCLARQRPLSFDASLVGIDDALAALDEATEALAARLDRDARTAPTPRASSERGLPLRLQAPTNDNAAPLALGA
jgi:hypothetical protein